MSTDGTPFDPTSASLQFDKAEGASAASSACTTCSRVLERYWTLNGKHLCGDCKAAIERHMTGPIPWRTWLSILLRGGGAALLGTLLYFGVLKLTGYELGLIAIVVGVLVGRAVLKASGGRRGWKLQLAAMALTYSSIVASYMPAVYTALRDDMKSKAAATDPAAPSAATTTTPTPAAPPAATAATSSTSSSAKPNPYVSHPFLALPLFFIILFVFAAFAPWMAGLHNILGLIIIGIALYEAWKINRRVPLVFAGPFTVSAAAPTVVAGAG